MAFLSVSRKVGDTIDIGDGLASLTIDSIGKSNVKLNFADNNIPVFRSEAKAKRDESTSAILAKLHANQELKTEENEALQTTIVKKGNFVVDLARHLVNQFKELEGYTKVFNNSDTTARFNQVAKEVKTSIESVKDFLAA